MLPAIPWVVSAFEQNLEDKTIIIFDFHLSAI